MWAGATKAAWDHGLQSLFENEVNGSGWSECMSYVCFEGKADAVRVAPATSDGDHPEPMTLKARVRPATLNDMPQMLRFQAS